MFKKWVLPRAKSSFIINGLANKQTNIGGAVWLEHVQYVEGAEYTEILSATQTTTLEEVGHPILEA